MNSRAFPCQKFAVALIACAAGLMSISSAVGQTVSNLWAFTTPFAILSSPAIGTNGTIYVGSYDRELHAVTPAGISNWSFAMPPDQNPNNYEGIYSSPAIGPDGTIYFGAEDGYLYALDPVNGSNKWAFQAGDAVYSDPAVGADGTIYVGSYSVPRSYLYALNPNGTELWHYPTSGTLAGIFSDPVVAPDSTIYFGCDDQNLYALNTNGTLRWTFPTGGPITASPAIGGDGTVYIGSTTSHKLFAVNPNGTQKWQYLASGIINSSVALGVDGTVYFGANGTNLYALNTNGTLKWLGPTGGNVRSSPAVAADGTIYVGADDGKLYAFDSNGSNLWWFATGDDVFSSPAIAPDGTVYVGSGDGKLYALPGTAGLANTPWPMFRHDVKRTGKSTIVTVIPPPIVESISPTTNGFDITWSSLPGISYRLQYKTNLEAGEWVDLPGDIQSIATSTMKKDASPTDAVRFYRIMVLP